MSSKNVPPRSGNPNPPKLNQAKPGVRIADQTQPGETAKLPRPAARPATPTSNSNRPKPSVTTVRPRRAAPPPPPPNNTIKIVVGAMLLLAAVVFISLLVLGNNNSNSTTANKDVTPVTSIASDVPIAADPTAQVETFANQGQQHLAAGDTVQSVLGGQSYNSNPPTSGPHLPYASPWGIFPQAVRDELQVHNLEHGGIVIQYVCPQGCPATVNSLSAYAVRYPPTNFTGVLLAPRDNLPTDSRIALTAWTHRLLLKSFDRDKIEGFIKTYIGKGPEQDSSFRP